MTASSSSWTMTLPSDVRLLASVRAFIEGICRLATLDEEITSAVVLATHEAANNVIRHAHQNNPAAVLQIQCCLTAAGIEIALHDEGEHFDFAAVPHLDPSELRLGGRGVFLIRSLMDEISCAPRPARGNTLRMVKRLPGQETARHAG